MSPVYVPVSLPWIQARDRCLLSPAAVCERARPVQVSLYASEILVVSVGEAGSKEMLTSLCADRNLELCQVSKLFTLTETVSVTAVEVDAF